MTPSACLINKQVVNHTTVALESYDPIVKVAVLRIHEINHTCLAKRMMDTRRQGARIANVGTIVLHIIPEQIVPYKHPVLLIRLKTMSRASQLY